MSLLDAALLSYATRYPDGFLELQRHGISEGDFVDEHRVVWKHITKSKREHDSVPSPAALRIRFPDLELPQVKKRDMPDLIQQTKQRRKYMDFLAALNQAATSATSFETVDDVMQQLQGQLNSLAYSGGKNHLVDLFSAEVNERVVEEIKRRRSGKHIGIPTGLQKFDAITGGLQKQQMVTIIGRPGLGKASACSEPVLTPSGWVPMGDLWLGDEVVTPDGSTAVIKQVHPQGVVDIYRVTFSDRTHTDVTADHLWHTTLNHGRKPGVRSTTEIAETLRLKHYIPLVEPAEYPDRNQPLDPYLLGALLGDGSLGSEGEVGFSCVEEELWSYMQDACPDGTEFSRYSNGKSGQARWVGGRNTHRGPNPIVEAVRSLKLEGTNSHTKFIPASYLWASSRTRLEVLRGIMDTDGHIGAKSSSAEYSTKSEQLALDVKQLVESLGGTAKLTRKKCGQYSDAYLLWVRLPRETNPFRLSRKAERWAAGTELRPYRRVVSVELVRQEEAQCITIDHPDHLYVTRNHIVTHNSWLDLLFMASAVLNGNKVILYPLEMTLYETAFRLYTLFSQRMFGQDRVLRNYDLTMGKVTKRKVVRFLNVLEDRFEGQLFVADVASLSDPYTNERIEAEVEVHKPDMFWVDYLTLLKPPASSGGDSDWQAVRMLSNGIKNTAMRRNTVGGCSAQVNREAMRANVFLPRLEHIAYGDSIGQDADKVITINRKKDFLHYALVKNRGGMEIGNTRVRWMVDSGLIEEAPEEDIDDDDEGDED